MQSAFIYMYLLIGCERTRAYELRTKGVRIKGMSKDWLLTLALFQLILGGVVGLSCVSETRSR